MRHQDKIISEEFYSNCLFEAIKAKLKNPKVKLYFRKPYLSGLHIRSMHVLWEDEDYSYDFSDGDYDDSQVFWKYFWHKGYIRRWRKDFARRFVKRGLAQWQSAL